VDWTVVAGDQRSGREYLRSVAGVYEEHGGPGHIELLGRAEQPKRRESKVTVRAEGPIRELNFQRSEADHGNERLVNRMAGDTHTMRGRHDDGMGTQRKCERASSSTGMVRESGKGCWSRETPAFNPCRESAPSAGAIGWEAITHAAFRLESHCANASSREGNLKLDRTWLQLASRKDCKLSGTRTRQAT
jgi:hypothetical protein